ncbi:hypothetical protein BJX70DRAFT_395393 [Aspergillus crustosus]
MRCLQGMPDDILLLIVSYVVNPKDITALSIQFRRVHPLCDLPIRRKYSRIRIRKDHHLDNAFKFLLSILRKPRLGLYVHRLEVDRQARNPWNYEMTNYERTISTDDLANLKTAIAAAFTKDEREPVLKLVMQKPCGNTKAGVQPWLHPDYNRTILIGQAIAALLITVCPHLEHLVMVPFQKSHMSCTGPKIPPLDMLIGRTGARKGSSQYLQDLRAIEFLTPLSDNVWRLGPSSSMVKLDGPMYEYHGAWSKICCIHLHNCDLSTRHLASILCCVERLRQFTYTTACVDIATGGVFSQTEPPQKFNPATLLRCILRHKSSLEYLDLDLAYRCVPFGDALPISVEDRMLRERYLEHPETHSPPEPLEFKPGSLRDCTALTRLRIDVVTLFYLAEGLGPVLPRNIESIDLVHQLPPDLHALRVRGYEAGKIHYYDRQLWALLRQGKKARPSLHEVKGIKRPIKQNNPLGFDPQFFRSHVTAIKPDDWTDYEY